MLQDTHVPSILLAVNMESLSVLKLLAYTFIEYKVSWKSENGQFDHSDVLFKTVVSAGGSSNGIVYWKASQNAGQTSWLTAKSNILHV